MAFDPERFEKAWDAHWGSTHEAGHVVVARHFGLSINFVDLNRANIDHKFYESPDCENSRQRLIVSAAGDAATRLYFKFGNAGTLDDARSRARLRDLGASESLCKRLMSDARREAERLVIVLRPEIQAVAWQLQQERLLYQTQIDAAMETARNQKKYRYSSEKLAGFS